MLYYAKVIVCRITAQQWKWLIFLILTGTLFVVFIKRPGEKNHLKMRAFSKSLLETVTAALILWSTLFLRTPGTSHQANLIPLWSWYQGFLQGNYEIRWQIYFNILLFMPFGFFSYLSKPRPLGRNILRGFLLSLFIEVSQYVFCLGLFEWDDLLHNTLGCAMGSLCGAIVQRVWSKVR